MIQAPDITQSDSLTVAKETLRKTYATLAGAAALAAYATTVSNEHRQLYGIALRDVANAIECVERLGSSINDVQEVRNW